MIITPEEYVDMYHAMKADTYNSEERKICVFASTSECDSLCAFRILQAIFQADHVHYSTYLVEKYEDVIETYNRDMRNDDQQLKTFLLINCGATEDLYRMLGLPEHVRLVVVDSHRPIHHNYSADDKRVIVLAVDGTESADVPEPEGASDVGSSDDEQGSEGNSGDENQPPTHRQRTSGEGSHPGVSRQRKRKQQRKEMRRRRKTYYEKGSSWSTPAAYLMWDLAYRLQLEDANMLWLAIVGMTDHRVHQRMSAEKYEECHNYLQTAVSTLRGGGDDDVVPLVQEDGEGTLTTVCKPHYGRITAIQELQFPLLRHWTLYDSMLHSTHVAVRLRTWHDKGVKNLEELLAKMGMPLEQCKHSYSSMWPHLKRALPTKLAENAPSYKLSDLTFKSFQLEHGYGLINRQHLTATDMVYAVTALLEASSEVPQKDAQPDTAQDKFWRAWQACSVQDCKALHKGLELSKKLQRAIIHDGGHIYARKVGMSDLLKCRVYDLSEQEISAKELLAHPLALSKLAVFFHEAHLQQTNKRKPIVVVGPRSRDDAEAPCLVVAFVGQPRLGTAMGNKFGISFEKAAQNIGAVYRHDSFDSAVFEVSPTDVSRFTTELGLL